MAVILLGPRWALALPLIPLSAAAIWRDRRSLWVLAACALIIGAPVLDLRVHPGEPTAAPGAKSLRLRVVTLNTHGAALDRQAMAAFLDEVDPDLVALQEYAAGSTAELFPANGERRWFTNSPDWPVNLASRYRLTASTKLQDRLFSSGRDAQAAAYEVLTPAGPLHLLNVRLESPHPSLLRLLRREPGATARIEWNVDQRRQQAINVARYASGLAEPVIIVGDFNTAANSSILQDGLSGFANAFSDRGNGYGWTYRSGGIMARIDQVFSRGPLVCRRCWVGPDVGSPHRPLVADFEWRLSAN
jgi:endonuclease/exonuclease/phosphatase (EEP) superfamily protein YafD